MRLGLRKLSVAGVLSAVFPGACATAPMEPGMEQGPLALTLLPDVPTVTIHPTRVTVKNGSGEVLLDGAPDQDNRLSGNPAPKKFDGTLEITTRYDNGTSKTQTVKHDPARSISLAWDDTSKQYLVRELAAPKSADKFAGEPGWAIQVFGDYNLRADGSIQSKFMFGVEKRF